MQAPPGTRRARASALTGAARRSAARYDVEDSTLTNELQQLGLPKGTLQLPQNPGFVSLHPAATDVTMLSQSALPPAAACRA